MSNNRRSDDDPEILAAKKIKEKADYLWKTIIAGLLTSVFAMMVWFVQREIANRDKREESYQQLVKLVEGHDRQITLINAKLIALDARYTSVMVLKNIEQQLTIFGAKGATIPLRALQKPITEELNRIEAIKHRMGEAGASNNFEGQ
jgi:hypothetical protein